MTMVFCDSMSHYATADIDKKYTGTDPVANPSLAPAIASSDPLRAGSNYMDLQSSVAELTKALGASVSRYVIGFRLRFATLPTSSNRQLFALINGATSGIEAGFGVSSSGQIAIYSGPNLGTASIVGLTTFALQVDQPAYVEFDVQLGASGHVIVRKNGVIGFDDDVAIGVAYSMSAIRFGASTGYSGLAPEFCDLYILDGNVVDVDVPNDEFLGDVQIDALFPISDVQNDFTPSTGVNHWALVDEAVPSTADYNDGTNVGDRDSFLFETVPTLASYVFYGVQAVALMNKTDAGAKNAAVMAQSGGTTVDGPTVGIGVDPEYIHHVFEVRPSTGAAWTEATVNGADFGVVVTA